MTNRGWESGIMTLETKMDKENIKKAKCNFNKKKLAGMILEPYIKFTI